MLEVRGVFWAFWWVTFLEKYQAFWTRILRRIWPTKIWKGLSIEKTLHDHPKRDNTIHLGRKEDPPRLPLEDSTIAPLKILSKEACTKEVSYHLARHEKALDHPIAHTVGDYSSKRHAPTEGHFGNSFEWSLQIVHYCIHFTYGLHLGDGLITHHSTIHHLRGGDSYLEGDILQHAPFQMESPWAAAEDSLEKTLHTRADIQILISIGRTILKGSTQCTTQFFLEGMVAFLTCTCSRSLWEGCHMHQESNLHAWK